MNITNEILQFRNFLNVSWSSAAYFFQKINDESEKEEIMDAWLEANWELLIENAVLPIGGQLHYYGNGADMEDGRSKLYYYAEGPNTHRVVCSSSGKTIMDYANDQMITFESYDFERFINFSDDKLIETKSPFDFVLLLDQELNVRIFSFMDVQFYLNKASME